MNLARANRSFLICRFARQRALTLTEVLVTLPILAFVAFLLAPATTHNHCKAVRINCASNLKQVALAFRIWEGDHGDRFPMLVYTNKLGEPLFTDAYRYFQVMSNELNNPKVVYCPADKKRDQATNLTSDFNDSHLSYFVALQADETMPNCLLAGDRNITNGLKPINRILDLTTNQTVGWTQELHDGAGNVALCDGSVQQLTSHGLLEVLKQTGLATNRLLFPQ